MASQEEDVEVVASGIALQQVSSWLGVDAEAVLAQENNPAVEAMFNKPHPSLLGLGAKYLSHKSMEASGLELRLKHKLRKSAGAEGSDQQQQGQYQPAQLDRHQHKRRRQETHQQGQPGSKVWRHSLPQQQQGGADGSDSEDEDDAGKLRQLGQQTAGTASGVAQPGKVLNRQQLLQVPPQRLSKWQRKRLREKAKRGPQQQ